MNDFSEPSLWAIVVALAGVIVWGGKRVVAKLDDCEKDREILHKKITKVATACSAATGVAIDLDSET